MAAADVVVVGAGPAGTRAALTLVSAGLKPIVIDENANNGGQIYRRRPKALSENSRTLYGFEAAKADALHHAFDAARDNLDFRAETTVWDVTPETLHLISRGRRASQHWNRLIIASGAMDRVIPFPGWTLPGVYTLGGAQTALKAQGALIGKRTVFFGTGPLLYLAALQYAKAGSEITLLDTSSFVDKVRALPGILSNRQALAKGLYYVAQCRMRARRFHTGVSQFEVVADPNGNVARAIWIDRSGRELSAECDAVATGFNLVSQTQLADLCELPFAFDPLQRQWLPAMDDYGRAGLPGVYLAGDGAAVGGADVAELAGERAALALLTDLGWGSHAFRIAAINRTLDRHKTFRHALDATAFSFPATLARTTPDDVVVCRCEGVTARQIRESTRTLSAEEINRAKAFTRVGMGRCQGRVCGPVAAEIISAATGRDIAEVGRIRGQAPIKPVPLSALAQADASA